MSAHSIVIRRGVHEKTKITVMFVTHDIREALYLADKGFHVTATDLTPRHIEYINNQLKQKPYSMQTNILDARDLSIFDNESFDIVLNMGPFYHLVDAADREKCMNEGLRVLKCGGLFITAYILHKYVFCFPLCCYFRQ